MLHWIGGILFGYCLCCDVFIGEYDNLCMECGEQLKPYQEDNCWCGKTPCDCHIPFFVAYEYNRMARRLLFQIKYNNNVALMRFCAHKLSSFVIGKRVFVPIPTSRAKLFTRTYNQAVELSRYLAQYTDNDFAPFVLKKTKLTTQAGKSKEERYLNTESILLDNYGEIINQDIIIVDDLIASGATITKAIELLRPIAKSIQVLAISRTYKNIPNEELDNYSS